MPRKPRHDQVARSLVFHVINRGILKQTIFHDDNDYSHFLACVRRFAQRASVSVYHWCLMPNHYHVVLELPRPQTISKLVGAWQQVYAVRYHKRHNTAGKLFQGRFKSQAIEKESYLLACGRYVEQNPVRAGMCVQPWDWPWSSAGYYVEGREDQLTACDPLWTDRDHRVYRDWLEVRAEDHERLFASAKDVIGAPEFEAGLARRGGRVALQGRGRRREARI